MWRYKPSGFCYLRTDYGFRSQSILLCPQPGFSPNPRPESAFGPLSVPRAAREEFEVESLLRWPTASQLTYTRRVICIEETTRNITRLGVCIRTSARIRLASQPAASANSEGSREIYGTNPVWRLRSGEVESRTPRSSASSVTSRRGVASTLPRAIYDERRSCSEQGTADIGGNRFIR